MTIILKVKGLVTTKKQSLHTEEIFVQYAVDETGKTLSLGNDDIMISIPFEPLEEAITEERKKI